MGQLAWDVDAQGDFVQQATYGGSIELSNASTAVAEPVDAAVTALGSTISDAAARLLRCIAVLLLRQLLALVLSFGTLQLVQRLQ
jgi:hypothetical protein